MLGHLVDHAKLRLMVAKTRYGGLMLVGASFAVAGGFAIAAIFIAIAQRAGPLVACVTMAVAFVLFAIVVLMITLSREQTQRLALRQAAQNTAITASFASMMPMVFRGGRRLAQSPVLSRPLLLGSVLIAALYVLRPRSSSETRSGDA